MIKVTMGIDKARVLVMLGDSVTTDHISPAGAIPTESPAGLRSSRALRRPVTHQAAAGRPVDEVG